MTDAVAAYRRKRDIAFETLSKKFEVVKPGRRVLHLPQGPRRHDAPATSSPRRSRTTC